MLLLRCANFRKANDDQARHQRPRAGGRRRSHDAAPLCAARQPRPERRQVRLRARPMRRLRGDGRWRRDLFVPDTDLGAREAQDPHPRGTGQRREARADTARVHRGAGGAVRLLHPRDDDARAGAARAQSRRFASRDQGCAAAAPLPLRHAHAHRARGGARRRAHAGQVMNRRDFLATGGVLFVAFAIPAWAQKLPGALERTPLLDAWLRIGADGRITVFTGKAELGQGIKTAILQLAADQLAVEMKAVELVTADTALTPNEGYTAGSNSMKDSGTAILHAAAQARETLVAEAAKRFGVPAEKLMVENGQVVAPDGRRIGYGAMVEGKLLNVRAAPESKLSGSRKF